MKIVIAGGSGFLGKSLIDSWSGINHDIFVLTRKKSLSSSTTNGVNYIVWDPKQTDDWVPQLENSDIIINLVGQSLASGFRWTKGLKKKLHDSRTIPTETLSKAISQLSSKPKTFIQISGANYYDYSFEPQDEDSPPGKGFLSKLTIDWEDASKPVEETGVQRLILRLSPVIAKQSLLIKLLRLPYRFFAGGRYGLKGDQWFSWVSVGDFTGFIDFAITNNLSGIYNLSAPEPIQNKDMNRIIGKTLKRPWFIPVPGFVLKLALGQKSELLLKSTRVISKKISLTGYTFRLTSFETCFKQQMTKK